MKLRDKKILNFIFISTVGIGFTILMINPTRPILRDGNYHNTESVAMQNSGGEISLMSIGTGAMSTSLELMNMVPSLTPSPIPTPTPSPTPTPLPVYALEEDGFPPEINTLIQAYYGAKVRCDMKTLKSISSDPTAMIDKDSLLKLVEGIDDYINIKCYVKNSYIKDTYIVYAYYEIKFIGLKTSAPSLSKLYVVTDTSGAVKIFDGEMEEELKAYFDARSEDADVLALREQTESLAANAKEKDEDLCSFWDILDNY